MMKMMKPRMSQEAMCIFLKAIHETVFEFSYSPNYIVIMQGSFQEHSFVIWHLDGKMKNAIANYFAETENT